MLQVDAFTTEPFAGNPAAVCLLDAAAAKQLGPERLQQVAAEYNQPATAFVTLLDQDDNYDTSASLWIIVVFCKGRTAALRSWHTCSCNRVVRRSGLPRDRCSCASTIAAGLRSHDLNTRLRT